MELPTFDNYPLVPDDKAARANLIRVSQGIHRRILADCATMNSSRQRRFYLITVPRVTSNLLVRILALDKQPNVLPQEHFGGYLFEPAWRLINHLNTLGKHIEGWTEDEREQMKKCYQDCFNNLQSCVERAEAEGKILFVKEHACFMADPVAQTKYLYGQDSVTEAPWTVQIPSTYAPEPMHSSLNMTVLPDEFLKTWLPTFLIRHPALVFPSRYRAFLDTKHLPVPKPEEIEQAQLELAMTFHWMRTLFDWYSQHLSDLGHEPSAGSDVTWPLVLDADDVLTKPEVIARLCEIMGMDPTKLQFEWAPATAEELAKIPGDIPRRMLSTLSASAGILEGKTAANLDMDTEVRKWREEFGEREGEKMEKWVKAAMPDYKFMKAKRLRLKPE